MRLRAADLTGSRPDVFDLAAEDEVLRCCRSMLVLELVTVVAEKT